MKKKVLIYLLVILMLLMPIYTYAENGLNSTNKSNITVKYVQEEQKKIENTPVIGCKAAYVAEPITGKVIYEKNAHEKMYPASTTKILTALVVMEKCEMNETAMVSKHALDIVPNGYSNANLKEGESHTIKDLLYALMLPSANEAANVLAEHVSGSVEKFAELCNSRAKELGCENLHFLNANGMHDENHYCTAYDLYLIAKECQKHEEFNEIVKTKDYTLPSTKIYPGKRTIRNTNELLFPGTYYYSYCNGIKTGHTTPAGECLVASSSYNNMDLISVVLGGKTVNSQGQNDRFSDTKKLFEFTYDNYQIKEIAKQGDVIANITVGKATEETSNLDVIVNNDISTILPNDINRENIKATISINDNIVAPIQQNQVLGQITYDADGLIYKTDIVASHSVEKLPYVIYIAVLVVSTIVIFAIFYIILKIFKKHKKVVVLVEIVILIITCIAISPIIMKYMGSQETKIMPAENIKLETNYN